MSFGRVKYIHCVKEENEFIIKVLYLNIQSHTAEKL